MSGAAHSGCLVQAELFDPLGITSAGFGAPSGERDPRGHVSIVTTSDLILARQDDPVYLVQHVSRQDSPAGIAEILQGMPNLMVQWVKSGVRAQQVSRILTAISDAATVRLIQLAEASLGPAPVPWCWVGFGSQARGEQLLGADQDNGMIISDTMLPEHAPWFEAMARAVCDGLNDCGYVYCPGDVMAMNPKWRQTLKVWKGYFHRWITVPEEKALMHNPSRTPSAPAELSNTAAGSAAPTPTAALNDDAFQRYVKMQGGYASPIVTQAWYLPTWYDMYRQSLQYSGTLPRFQPLQRTDRPRLSDAPDYLTS